MIIKTAADLSHKVRGWMSDRICWATLSIAFVVLKPETQLSAVDVTNFVAGRVAAYKHVRNVTFVEEIPKSASGKILRRVLRDRLKEGAQS